MFFYGDDISKIKTENLLKATPYTKETEINFNYKLSKEEFFSHLYTGRADGIENDLFDKKVAYELQDLNNEFAKVSILHIAGYAGCGKTTFLYHLLWGLRERLGMYSIVDYQGSKRAVEPFIERIAHLIFSHCENKADVFTYFDLVAQKKLLNANRFHEYMKLLSAFSQMLSQMWKHKQLTTEYEYHVAIEKFEEKMPNEETFLAFLLFIDLLLLIYDRFHATDEDNPMLLVVDNSDSMDNLAEEFVLVPVLKQFANDCTYFFSYNLRNETAYNGKMTKDVFDRTKLVIILTTRFVTIKRYEIIEPDWESLSGWTSLSLPENYYDHKEILNHRIDYFLSTAGKTPTTVSVAETTDKAKSETNSNNLESRNGVLYELVLIKTLESIVARNPNFKRLFNGNVRMWIERLCGIVRDFPEQFFNEIIALSKNPSALEGVHGYFLSLILDTFKRGDIYTHKLKLSPCRKDGTLSLSRIVLTFLRENENRCSLHKIFQSLVPVGFAAEDICEAVWNLCEGGRRYWRRLLLFELVVPRSLEELQTQAFLFKNGENNVERYSELVICKAGLAYMEFVVPHFEFMLSRHEMGASILQRVKYLPLFSETSEQLIGDNIYRFESKIDTVFNDVKDCCYNSVKLANRVMAVYKLTRDEYIQSTAFNYHTVGWDGEAGPKQSYESRLIFRHLGYVEKYRRYLLEKILSNSSSKIGTSDLTSVTDKDADKARIINEKLVSRILNYIELYRDSNECFQTGIQDMAADKLYQLAIRIKKSNYMDFDTRIELDGKVLNIMKIRFNNGTAEVFVDGTLVDKARITYINATYGEDREELIGIVRMTELNIEYDNQDFEYESEVETKIWNDLCVLEYNAMDDGYDDNASNYPEYEEEAIDVSDNPEEQFKNQTWQDEARADISNYTGLSEDYIEIEF